MEVALSGHHDMDNAPPQEDQDPIPECWSCNKSLAGQRYVMRNDHAYCMECFKTKLANKCEKCKEVIDIDSKELFSGEQHWHEKCFKCARCEQSLADKPFMTKDEELYCSACYDDMFAGRCVDCHKPFRAGTKKFDYKGQQWHNECFTCALCNEPIGEKRFVPRDDGYVCVPCFEGNLAQKCNKCLKVIKGDGVTYKDTPYHADCFTCTGCRNQLAGQRFTSMQEEPYCIECYTRAFAKKCSRCQQPITGFDGEKFVSFEDQHWHSGCFVCHKCETPLAGKGFLLDQGNVTCPECAKA